LTSDSKFWSAGIAALLAVLAIAAAILPQSFRLTALSDVIQCLLLLAGTMFLVPRAREAQGRMRLFWTLMALGIGFWCFYQLLWTYFEVWLRTDVPTIFWGDIVLFLHLVPLIAALAMRPHVPRDEYAARLGHLDFALLLIWWVYVYVFVVMSWQYALADEVTYTHNLNAVYLAEKLVMLSALATCWVGSRGPWRIFYANLFGASALYGASSFLANWAIARHAYYSGSFYDIPLAGSMAWIALLALWTSVAEPESQTMKKSPQFGVWVARGGMIAVFSLPLFASWALADLAVPPSVRSFRLVLTLAAALIMSIMVFVRQHLLDRELIRLLHHSEASVENLVHLQAQVLQSEKVASIGQLVGGAAHELNNPITAMLGYSDLLLGTDLSPEQRSLAMRIGQNVRQIKSLVASLLSFARKANASKIPIDLNTLARTAIKLTQPHWQAHRIDLRVQLDNNLPKVLGDSNQLLQVCVQAVGSALYAIDDSAPATLTISSYRQDRTVILRISPSGATATVEGKIQNEAKPILGLSACQGIVQEHQGRIVCHSQSGGGEILVELPLLEDALANGSAEAASEAGGPALLQSQPFA
jgi:signal transduction histidine kinase